MKVVVQPGKPPAETPRIRIGGSKSESARLLILQALFPGIEIENCSGSDDTKVLRQGLEIKQGICDIGHAGTAMRFLTAYYSILEGSEVILTGSNRMKERPVEELVTALRKLGAQIEYLEREGFPPLKINGTNLTGNFVEIDASVSSQYISALMLIGPALPEGLTIALHGKPTSVPYIEMTASLLNRLGILVKKEENRLVIPAAAGIKSKTITVESDWSSASYYYSLAALSKNRKISLQYFSENSLQGDWKVSSIFENLGVATEFYPEKKEIIISGTGAGLPEFLDLDLNDTPDLAQTLAVCCFGLGTGCRLTGLHTLKIKETDRLLALQTELQKLGAEVETGMDFLNLNPGKKINPGIAVDTYLDHRMAMAFAPLAAKTRLQINNPSVVSKSYPHFWDDWKNTGIKVRME